MHVKALSSVFLLLELVTVATAAPYVEKRSFKVERVRNEAFTGRNGPRALAKVYRKYGMPLPPGLVSALETQDAVAADSVVVRRRAGKWRPPEDKTITTASAASSVDDFDAFEQGGDGGQDDLLGELLGGVFDGIGGGNNNNNNGGNNAGIENGNQSGNRGGSQGGNRGGSNNAGNDIGDNAGNGAGNRGGSRGGKQGGKQGGNQGGNNNNNGSNNNGNNNNGNNSGSQDPLAGVRNQTGLVVNRPEKNDVEYLSTVKIGGQPVTLDFDTGSSDLWVFNTQLAPEQVAGRPVYDPTKSKTFKMLDGARFQVRYGDGSGASGNVGTDVVDVGGAVAPAQAVEMATTVTDTFVRDAHSSGLLGLAFGRINTVTPQRQATFFENVMPSLREPVFTADLRGGGAAGAYEFGRVDAGKFKGDMAWIPVDSSKGFWQFSSESFAVGGGRARQATRGGSAIADTGTTLLLADAKIVEGYYAQVPQARDNEQAGGVTVPCDAELPDLNLDIGGQYMARIKGDDIKFAPIGNGGECFGGLQAAPANSMGVYGDIMFKSQFVAFNGGNNSIGMAEHI